MVEIRQLAHDVHDERVLRSKDVELDEEVVFQDLQLSCETIDGLRRCGFERPSPIQLQTIPIGRCGFDLVVQSKAGTGKTCVFAIVALEALRDRTGKSTQTIVVAPTREIATQIHEVISQIGACHEQLNCGLFVGGFEVKQDRKKLSEHCQIVVGTPGRLKQLIDLNILKTQHIELLVIDEADKLMDEQFKTQIDGIYRRLPQDKQMIVTSATYTEELAQFLQQYMQVPKSVRLGTELSLEAIREFFLESKAGNSAKRNLDNKVETLKKLLDQETFTKCFVFTNYQDRARILCESLNKSESFLERHGRASYFSAELSQADRNSVFSNFRKDTDQRILISTDISARGIDINDIELVINFDLPTDKATYFHRIGRAGRFGQPGRSISIVSRETVDQTIFSQYIKSDRIEVMRLHSDEE